jgi:amidase
MPVQRPSADALQEIAKRYAMELSPEEIDDYKALVDGTLASYDRLDQLVEPKLDVRYPRTSGRRPSQEDNPLNAWYQRCSIKGASEGRLSGKRVAIKDNAAVAGVPMMNGSAVLEGFVPDVDATVVTRILDAGGEIVGKAVCEHLCFSGGSHTSDTGPVLNPHDHTRSSGGSSSGSAALVVAGEVDLALGGDQGGSIRLPASFSGAYGLKGTFGLVPYTGIYPIERTLDHTGPIAATPSDCALMLQVIAGPDGLDARQVDVRVDDYLATIDDGVEGLRIGILQEGFGHENSEADVDDAVRTAAQELAGLGATVETVSIPWHLDAIHVWRGIAIEGALALMVRGNGGGTGAKGFYDDALMDFFGRARLRDANHFSVTTKVVMMLAEHLQTNYGGRYYGKAQNLVAPMKAAYDEAFSRFDVLLTPTTPMKATPIPAPDAGPIEIATRALEMIANTAPFNATGHPAINIPCAMSDGLPVGLQAVGADWSEATLLRLARACETSFAPAVGPGRAAPVAAG